MTWSLEEAVSYYRTQGAPKDQSALIALLKEVQQHHAGFIPTDMVMELAGKLDVKESFLHALIKRIPSLRLKELPCLELCAGPNCGKHIQLAKEAERLQTEFKGSFTLKFTPCMRMCGKGPNVKWNGTIYHQATKELLYELVSQIADK